MTSAAPLAALIIGEHSSIAAALTAVLNQLGATLIDHAPNGAAALLLMREKSYQLLISDWAMEPVSGLQLLKFVRAEPELAHVRFIIACPRGDRAAEMRSGKLGRTVCSWSRRRRSRSKERFSTCFSRMP